MSTLAVEPAVPPMSPRKANLAIAALSIGGFAIGTTEFVTMGLLPEIAHGTGVSIPEAGHYVSAYAAGVVVGAPLIALLGARLPRKGLLMGLMVAFAIANIASGLVDGYWPLMIARFLSGMPHGAYFGIGGLIAASLVAEERRTWAIAMILAGIGTANVLGVPISTLLGQKLHWGAAYLFVGAVGVLTVLAVSRFVPRLPLTGEESILAELGALKRVQVWYALLIGTIGFGGMFATYSYITPTMTELGGFHQSTMPILLALYGCGSVLGTLLAGRLAAHGLMRGITGTLVAMALLMSVFAFLVRSQPVAVVSITVLGLLPSLLVPMLQTRLMDVAHEGQALAANLNHATLNTANALGAWLGSVVLAHGMGYAAPSRVGACLAAMGVLIAVASAVHQRRTLKAARSA